MIHVLSLFHKQITQIPTLVYCFCFLIDMLRCQKGSERMSVTGVHVFAGMYMHVHKKNTHTSGLKATFET